MSNLVMDKFHFPKAEGEVDRFYHYLGVRQATNLMTTGSMERSVSVAVLSMVADQERMSMFREWLALVFPGGSYLAFEFPRLKRADLTKYLSHPDKLEYIQDRLERRSGRGRIHASRNFSVEEIANDVSRLFEFLISEA
ncbi:hypothetical protein ACVBEH_24760, partial [Roseateles sp. GG27B]